MGDLGNVCKTWLRQVTRVGCLSLLLVAVGASSSARAAELVWQAIGPIAIPIPNAGALAAGKLQAFAVNWANPLVMYEAGGIGPGNSGPYTEAGIYKTTDGGNSWTSANVGLTDPTVDVLLLDQNDPSTLLAGTFFSGIFRSDDDGANWSLVGPFGSTTALLQIDTTFYAGSAPGIVQSTDGGVTWSLLKSTSVPVRALGAAGGALYVGLQNGQVLIQPSPGAPWITTNPTGTTTHTVWAVAVNPANKLSAFVVEWLNYTNPDLYVTSDGGVNWTPVTNLNCPVQFVAFAPSTAILYAACGGAMFASLNAGSTWSPVLGAVWDIRTIFPDVGGVPGDLAVGSDQGLYLLPAGASDWQSLNGNITSSILFGLAVQGSTILTTAQDFSPISSFDAGATWQHLQGASPPVGEGGTAVINPGNPQYAYVFTTAGFQYSTDGGQTFTQGPAVQLPPGSGNGLIAVDPSSPSTVYLAAGAVLKSTDWGVTWTSPGWPISDAVMVAVDPTDSNTLFVGRKVGALMVTHNAGSTWTASNLGGACGAPVTLAVTPSNPQIVFVGMSGFLPCGGILRSMDGGANFGQVNTGLAAGRSPCQFPPFPRVQFAPSGSSMVAAATMGGLYLSSDLGDHWTNSRGNAVPIAFNDVTWSGGSLYALACGEGVLSMPWP